MTTMDDEEFARAFAHLMEVLQNGKMRPATPNDVLELVGPPRYVLKRENGDYLAEGGKGFSPKQRRALVIDDLEYAREAKKLGLEGYGVKTKIVRIRRRGTLGLEAVRLRPDLKISSDAETIGISMPPADAMQILATLRGAKQGKGVQ